VTWQFVIAGFLVGVLGRDDRDGRRQPDDADADPR